MTEIQGAVFATEAFLTENYQFRRNVLSGKTEVCPLPHAPEDSFPLHPVWRPVTAEVMNSVIRHAKKEGVGGDKSPKQNIEEYIGSDAIPTYDPVRDFFSTLPPWDGHNHVADLFGRLPGISSEQLSWCSVWIRAAVAHWLGMDTQHGNECVPVLIGPQGCGKSTFAVRLLPPHLRTYYLDNINFGNKFDSEMALTNNLLVNIDEFANMGPSQQAKLKQTLSKVKVNGRPIFGRCQEDRTRYASFLATTNDPHPLCDPTGSRRYLCLRIMKGALIDNQTPINYPQLYAQVLHELREEQTPYWFTNDEVARIQKANLPFFKTDDMEHILTQCFHLPEAGEEGQWISCKQVSETLIKAFPSINRSNATNIRIGQTLRGMGCQTKHSRTGVLYHLVASAA